MNGDRDKASAPRQIISTSASPGAPQADAGLEQRVRGSNHVTPSLRFVLQCVDFRGYADQGSRTRRRAPKRSHRRRPPPVARGDGVHRSVRHTDSSTSFVEAHSEPTHLAPRRRFSMCVPTYPSDMARRAEYNNATLMRALYAYKALRARRCRLALSRLGGRCVWSCPESNHTCAS
jgi:hypothetical protein